MAYCIIRGRRASSYDLFFFSFEAAHFGGGFMAITYILHHFKPAGFTVRCQLGAHGQT